MVQHLTRLDFGASVYIRNILHTSFGRRNVQMVEFDSYVENGIIHVPPQYKDELPGSVRVLVFPKAGATELSDDLEDLYGIFEGMDVPDKKELRKTLHEKHRN